MKEIKIKPFLYKNDRDELKTIRLTLEAKLRLSSFKNWTIPTDKSCGCDLKYWNKLYLKENITLVSKKSEAYEKYGASTIEAIIINKGYVMIARSFSGIRNVFIFTKIDDKLRVVFAHSNIRNPDE